VLVDAGATGTLDTCVHLWPDFGDLTRHAIDLLLGDSASSSRPESEVQA
jgi:hypothetical protein